MLRPILETAEGLSDFSIHRYYSTSIDIARFAQVIREASVHMFMNQLCKLVVSRNAWITHNRFLCIHMNQWTVLKPMFTHGFSIHRYFSISMHIALFTQVIYEAHVLKQCTCLRISYVSYLCPGMLVYTQ